METAEFLAKYRKAIVKRVEEQIARHRKITPNLDARAVIDIQIPQEKERFERLREGEESAATLHAIQGLLDGLPALAKELKIRKW
jgi:hypothetical protein